MNTSMRRVAAARRGFGLSFTFMSLIHSTIFEKFKKYLIIKYNQVRFEMKNVSWLKLLLDELLDELLRTCSRPAAKSSDARDSRDELVEHCNSTVTKLLLGFKRPDGSRRIKGRELKAWRKGGTIRRRTMNVAAISAWDSRG